MPYQSANLIVFALEKLVLLNPILLPTLLPKLLMLLLPLDSTNEIYYYLDRQTNH